MRVEALRQWRRLEQRRRFMLAGFVGALLLLLAIVGGVLWSRSSQVDRGYRNRSTVSTPIAPGVRLQLPPPDLYRPIAPEEALKLNAERAFSGRADTPATAFKLSGDKASTDRALECLTQAVYYEAASEGADGQRAVAQIVLNRMRHTAYPASVCGVVYQGSERTTGCQFTFTCDGSLARSPIQSLWKQARRIAADALGGKVFAPVGHATHYHADYVSPYWADSLDKSVQIGRHIFYRLKGGLGSKQAFNQLYAGTEPMPPSPSSVEVSLEAIESADPQLPSIPDSGLKVEAGELVQAKDPPPQIAADSASGKLLLDGDATPAKASSEGRKTQAEACPGGSTSGRLKPMSADNQRVQAQSGC
jgi:spore germination cell wall hydrolase CwlJ-like protein